MHKTRPDANIITSHMNNVIRKVSRTQSCGKGTHADTHRPPRYNWCSGGRRSAISLEIMQCSAERRACARLCLGVGYAHACALTPTPTHRCESAPSAWQLFEVHGDHSSACAAAAAQLYVLSGAPVRGVCDACVLLMIPTMRPPHTCVWRQRRRRHVYNAAVVVSDVSVGVRVRVCACVSARFGRKSSRHSEATRAAHHKTMPSTTMRERVYYTLTRIYGKWFLRAC